MSKIFTVFGATGRQGGSVIKALLSDPVLMKEYTLRGITRDVSKPAAKALAEKGVEMVSADMSSLEAVRPAVQGAHSVFFLTNFWETMDAEVEIAQGRAVTDASKEAGVKHIIFSSLLSVTEASKGRLTHVTHFDGKAAIEQYIRQSGAPATFVQPGFFMSNFLDSIRRNEEGQYTLSLPVDGEKTRIPMLDSARDIGKYVKAALKQSPSGKRILASPAYITPNQVIADFQEVTGHSAVYTRVPSEVYKARIPEPVAQELLENMLMLEDPGYYAGADLAESQELLDEKPATWKEFVEAYKSRWP